MATALLTGPSKSAAPGQYLGYALQPVRLCHHLMHAPPGCVVSLEYVDDIAIHWPDGRLLLEQSKSALSGNPLSDGSSELWKAFANWANLCAEESVDPATTTFRLYVCPVKEAGIALLMHEAKTDADAQALLTKIAKKVTLKNQLKGCNPKITEFLAAGEDLCKAIIRNFEIVTEADPLEPIKAMLRLAIPAESLDSFCDAAIGAAKSRVEALIRRRSTPALDAEAFRSEFRAFVRKHSILGLLVPTTEQPSSSEVTTLLQAAPVFVRQLLSIGLPQEYLVRAVSDFLRTDADRINWAADGRIVEDSLTEFNDSLERHFVITRDEIEDIHSARDEETRGRQIYRKCIGHQAPLEGRDVPAHFIPGSFNMLADAIRVGWHPNYTKLFGS